MSDTIIIALLFLIWFQGTRYSSRVSNWIDALFFRLRRYIQKKAAK